MGITIFYTSTTGKTADVAEHLAELFSGLTLASIRGAALRLGLDAQRRL